MFIKVANRKGGYDRKAIQIPNTVRSKTTKGKKDALKVTASQSKHLQAENQNDSFFLINFSKRLSKINQHIHAKTYNDITSKPHQKHRLGAVSKNIIFIYLFYFIYFFFFVGGGRGGRGVEGRGRSLNRFLRGHNPRP